MKPLRNSNPWEKICVSLIEETGAEMVRAVAKANRVAELIEVRMDYAPDAQMEPILKAGEKPIVITVRPRKQGGRFTGSEKDRLRILREAVERGAGFIDIEAQSRRFFLPRLQGGRTRTRTILSYHDFRGTPRQSALREICRRLAGQGADVVKIVTTATSWSDNFRVLSLLPYARQKNQQIVAFCMGSKGKLSRIFGPLMGAAWTYACLADGKKSAPGQLTAKEMREIWEMLG